MKVMQSTIERLLYLTLLLCFTISVATYAKLSLDDSKKFKILKQNQMQLICMVSTFTDFTTTSPTLIKAEITKCIEENS